MAFPALEQLLVLQDRDQRFSQVRDQLEEWPRERARTEADIQTERERVVAAEGRVRGLELQRAEIEGRVEDAESRIVKYRTQQLEVKKQDAYDALEHEITTLREQIDQWETDELDVLDAIDHAEKDLAEIREDVAARIRTLETHLRTIEAGMAENEAQVGEAETLLSTARASVTDPASLQLYDFVRRQVKRFPVVVPIEGGKCGGCHLKVSNDVESVARRNTDLVRCSSCGRLVYYER